MKTIAQILLLMLVPTMLLGEHNPVEDSETKAPEKLESLEIKSGKTYTKVTIREVTPSGIKIFHEAGAATIPYEDLPEDLQEALGGFDPEASQKHREETAKAQRKNDQALTKGILQQRKKKAEEERKKLIDGVKVPTRVIIKQMLDGTALCRVSIKTKRKFQRKTPRALGGDDVTEYEKWVWTSYSEEWYHVTGLPLNLVDGSNWEGWTLPSGKFAYTSAIGARKTVSQLTVVAPPEKK